MDDKSRPLVQTSTDLGPGVEVSDRRSSQKELAFADNSALW